MQNEAKGIVSELYQDFRQAKGSGNLEIKTALQKVLARIEAHQEVDLVLIDRLANYITYTVFTNKIRLTQTQNLLLSQLMSIVRTSGVEGSLHEHHLDMSQFD